MFLKRFKSAFIATVIGFGALVTFGGSANADVRAGVTLNGSGFGITIDNRNYGRNNEARRSQRRHSRGWNRWNRWNRWDNPRPRSRRWNRGNRWNDSYSRRNRCSPYKAVKKARRKGIRNAYVIRVNRRGVLVAGRRWGERVVIGFDRSRRCGVRFVRSNYY